MVRGMSAHGVRPCPMHFSARDKLVARGHLAICVYVYDYNNDTIIICIGLVHGIFMGNI